MKATFFAATAAMAGAASAANHRHAHQMFAKRGNVASTGFPVAPTGTGEVCLPGCTTIWKTITGEATRMCNPARLRVRQPDDDATNTQQWSPSKSPP